MLVFRNDFWMFFYCSDGSESHSHLASADES